MIAELSTALGALKLKRSGVVFNETRDGIEIHERGRPMLLLTFEAARRFANEIDEIEHG